MVKYKSMKPAKNKGSELQKARKAFNNFLEDYLEDEEGEMKKLNALREFVDILSTPILTIPLSIPAICHYLQHLFPEMEEDFSPDYSQCKNYIRISTLGSFFHDLYELKLNQILPYHSEGSWRMVSLCLYDGYLQPGFMSAQGLNNKEIQHLISRSLLLLSEKDPKAIETVKQLIWIEEKDKKVLRKEELPMNIYPKAFCEYLKENLDSYIADLSWISSDSTRFETLSQDQVSAQFECKLDALNNPQKLKKLREIEDILEIRGILGEEESERDLDAKINLSGIRSLMLSKVPDSLLPFGFITELFMDKVFAKLLYKLGFPDKYLFELLLKGKILPFYETKSYLKDHFYDKELFNLNVNEVGHKFSGAIKFIFANLLDCMALEREIFPMHFLTLIDMTFNKGFKERSTGMKEHYILGISRLFQLIMESMDIDKFWAEGIVLKLLNLYESLLNDPAPEIQEMGVQATYMALNALILNKNETLRMKYLDRYIGMLTQLATPTQLGHKFRDLHISNSVRMVLDILDVNRSHSRDILKFYQFILKDNSPKFVKLREKLEKIGNDIKIKRKWINHLLKALFISVPHMQYVYLSYIRLILLDQIDFLITERVIDRKISQDLMAAITQMDSIKDPENTDLILLIAQIITLIPQLGFESQERDSKKLGRYQFAIQDEAFEFGLIIYHKLIDKITSTNNLEKFNVYLFSLWRVKHRLMIRKDSNRVIKIPPEYLCVNKDFVFESKRQINYENISRNIDRIAPKRSFDKFEAIDNYESCRNLMQISVFLPRLLTEQRVLQEYLLSIIDVISVDRTFNEYILQYVLYMGLYYGCSYCDDVNEVNHIVLDMAATIDVLGNYFNDLLNEPNSITEHKNFILHALELLQYNLDQHKDKLRTSMLDDTKLRINDYLYNSDPISVFKKYPSFFEFLKTNDERRFRSYFIIINIRKFLNTINTSGLIQSCTFLKANKRALYYLEKEKYLKESKIEQWIGSEAFDNQQALELLSKTNQEDFELNSYMSGKLNQFKMNKLFVIPGEFECEQHKYLWENQDFKSLFNLIEKNCIDDPFLLNNLRNKNLDLSESSAFIYMISHIFAYIDKWVNFVKNETYEIIIEIINNLNKNIIKNLNGAIDEINEEFTVYLYILQNITQFIELTYNNLRQIHDDGEEICTPNINCKLSYELQVIQWSGSMPKVGFQQKRLILLCQKGLFKIISKIISWCDEAEICYAYCLSQLVHLYLKKYINNKTENIEISYELDRLFSEYELFIPFFPEYHYHLALYMPHTRFGLNEAIKMMVTAKETMRINITKLSNNKRKSLIIGGDLYIKFMLLLVKYKMEQGYDKKIIRGIFNEAYSYRQNEKLLVKFAEFNESYEPVVDFEIINAIQGYMDSLLLGHKYIWQSLHRALDLFFKFFDDGQLKKNSGTQRTNENFMKVMVDKLKNIPLYQIAFVVPKLLSRYKHPNPKVNEIIRYLLAKLVVNYPLQSSWWMLNLLHSEDEHNRVSGLTKKTFGNQIMVEVKSISEEATRTIMSNNNLFTNLINLSKESSNIREMPKYMIGNFSRSSALIVPTCENLSVNLPENSMSVEEARHFIPFKSKPPMIAEFDQNILIMSSKVKPKKIVIIGTDRVNYPFLLKSEEGADLSKERRAMEFVTILNSILRRDEECRKRGLNLRTFNVQNLTTSSGIIEWVSDTSTMKKIITDLWKENGIKADFGHLLKLYGEKILHREVGIKDKIELDKCWDLIKHVAKPVLLEWFYTQFENPECCWEALERFRKSTAVWSMTGYILGLGDRHGDNILLCKKTGEVIHIDFECLFEKAVKLPVPDIVQFRLTSNITNALGLFQQNGFFSSYCKVVLAAFVKNEQNIYSIFNSFLDDPISEFGHFEVAPKDALLRVTNKLTESKSNVSKTVLKLIAEASDERNLKKLFVGWMPWM